MPPAQQEEADVAAPAKAVHTLLVPKVPPRESDKAIWTRRAILLSFWLIALCLGLPLWWKTTTVYRAKLPLALMNDWADGKVMATIYSTFSFY